MAYPKLSTYGPDNVDETLTFTKGTLKNKRYPTQFPKLKKTPPMDLRQGDIPTEIPKKKRRMDIARSLMPKG